MSRDLIEAYLDELMQASRRLPPREARHLIAEAEAHLHDATDIATVSGIDPESAQRDAIAKFGSADDLVARERSHLRTPLRVLGGQVIRSAVVLGSVGAIAVGLSGLIAALFDLIGGPGAVATAPTPAELTTSNCARWLSHGGTDCRAAALSDWAFETIWYRIAFGVFGAAALLSYRWLAKRRSWRGGLSPVVNETIAITLFLCAAIWTLGMGIDATVVSAGHGSGQWFSATLIAAVAASILARRLTTRLRDPALA